MSIWQNYFLRIWTTLSKHNQCSPFLEPSLSPVPQSEEKEGRYSDVWTWVEGFVSYMSVVTAEPTTMISGTASVHVACPTHSKAFCRACMVWVRPCVPPRRGHFVLERLAYNEGWPVQLSHCTQEWTSLCPDRPFVDLTKRSEASLATGRFIGHGIVENAQANLPAVAINTCVTSKDVVEGTAASSASTTMSIVQQSIDVLDHHHTIGATHPIPVNYNSQIEPSCSNY